MKIYTPSRLRKRSGKIKPTHFVNLQNQVEKYQIQKTKNKLQ